jgi:hypothetical protein
MARSRVINLANFDQFTAINVLSDPGLDPTPHVIPFGIEILVDWFLENGKGAHNVLCGSRTDGLGVTQAQANAIFTALSTGAAWTALAAFLSSTTNLTNVSMRDLRAFNQPVISSNLPQVLGTSASPTLPSEVALAATFRTALVGPGNRGRMYVPGWATNALATGNVVAPAAMTALQNWLNTIPTALAAQGYTFCLRQPSRVGYTGETGKIHAARPAGTLPIITQTVRDNHWDSQRRRGLK